MKKIVQRLRSLSPKNCAIFIAILMASIITTAKSSDKVDSALSRAAIVTAQGQHGFMLGLDSAGDRIIAVGERGIILYSDNNGQNWIQAQVPVSVTLTAVSFLDAKNGFAVGHGGIVLSTVDAGKTWRERLGGKEIASIMFDQAQSLGDQSLITSAERLVAEGPDKPLLNLLVFNEKKLLVVGAYGIAMQSDDGGDTWVSLQHKIDNPGGMHIYSVSRVGDRIILAGEMGMVWLSMDRGETFSRIETPYEGSFFVSELSGNEGIILAGLRGNIWRSSNNGLDWIQIKSPMDSSITSLTTTRDGQLFMANQAGVVMGINNEKLSLISDQRFPPINDVIQTLNGDFVVASARGLLHSNLGLDE